MGPLEGRAFAVVGSGAFGLATAVRLAQTGAEVTLYDPAPLGDSASGVAAGMLAPAMEAALDPASDGHFPLLRAARDLWPAFLEIVGADPRVLDRSGALLLADTPEAGEAVRAALKAAAAQLEILSLEEARARAPGLSVAEGPCLFAADDWRLSPTAVLRALASAFLRAGGRIEHDTVALTAHGATLASGASLGGRTLVLAAGAAAAAFAPLAPELALLEPIKGQILHFDGGPASGPVVRTSRGYLAPQPGGAVVGATMEPGLADRRLDDAALARLRAEAERLFPALAGVGARGKAGVRASSPDGLPMVGLSSGREDLILAVGARRNGWLLAPAVADLVVRVAAGEDPGPFGEAFSPGRFRR